MQIRKIPNVNQLANLTKMSQKSIEVLFAIHEQRNKLSSTTKDAGWGIIFSKFIRI